MPRSHKYKPTNGQMWITFAVAAIILSFIAISSNYFNITGFQFGGGCSYTLGTISDLATSDPTASSVKITWTAPTYAAFGNDCSPAVPTYFTAYSTAAITSQNFAQANQQGGPPYADGTQSRVMTGLPNSCTQYYFAVKTIYQSAAATYSNSPNKLTAGTPSSPQNPSATAGTQKITLSWSAPATLCDLPVTNYEIYRATTSGGQEGQQPIATVGNVLTYDDTSGVVGTTYYYKILAKTSGGTSAASTEVSAAPEAAAPSAPTLLSATAADKKVTLTWSAPASNGGAAITSQKIYRGTQSGVLSLVKTFNDGTTTTYSDTGLTNDQVYYYKVSAVNSAGEGTKSNEMSGTPFLPSATKCSDGSDYGQCSSNKPKYCDNGNLTDNATVCLCPTGQTASGNACITPTPTETTQPTNITQPTQPTETTTPTTTTEPTGVLEPPENFDVLEGKARSAITVAESAIKVAKEDKKNTTDAVNFYNEAVSAYNDENYQTALDKAKEAANAAQTASLLEKPSAELPVTAIVALLVVIAVGGGVVYYYKNVYKKAQGAAPQTPQPEQPKTPTQRR